MEGCSISTEGIHGGVEFLGHGCLTSIYRLALSFYKDTFHEVRHLIDSWNTNIVEVNIYGWVSYLDQIMSILMSRWKFPWFMFVPRKPHTIGNEYHTI